LQTMAQLLKAAKGAGTGGAKGAPTAGSASGVGADANSSVAGAAPGGLSAGPYATQMSQIVAPAVAMAGLVKAGDKLKIGAKDQAHLYSKLLKKFTGMF